MAWAERSVRNDVDGHDARARPDDAESGRGLVKANQLELQPVSNEPALHAFAVIDRDYHVVASLYRVEPKRRSRQHEVSRFQ